MTILEGERVRLRPFRKDDAEALFAIQSNPAAMRYWAHAPWTEKQQAADKVAEFMALGDDARAWVIAERASDALIGRVALFHIDHTHLRCDLGYVLDPAYQGRGLALEACRLALIYAFDTLGLERIEADIDPRNSASRRLAERLGFQLEGTLRARWRVAGEVCDTVLYGLLKAELIRS